MPGPDAVQITLSAQQRDAEHKMTGKDPDAVQLSIEVLEERIAPMRRPGPVPLGNN